MEETADRLAADRLRFGIIGTSWIASWHARWISSHPRAGVVAVCSRDPRRARSAAADWGAPDAYTDYRELMDRAELDAVVIATPDYLHHEMVLHAARCGYHVICEKPLALSLEHAQQMLAAVEAAGVHHMTFFTFRWGPHFVRMQELIGEGYVGQPLYAELRYTQPTIPVPGPDGASIYDWHYDPARGTGVLGRIGSHLIFLALWLLGDIDSVACVGAHHFDRLGSGAAGTAQPADTVMITARFASGVVGSLHVSGSGTTPGQEQLLSVRGDGGVLEATLAPSLHGAPAGQLAAELAGPDDLWGGVDLEQPMVERLVELYATEPVADRQFIDDILFGRRTVPSLADGVRVQAVMHAAVEAERTGRQQRVPPSGASRDARLAGRR